MNRYIFITVVYITSFTAYCKAQYSYIKRDYKNDTLSKEQVDLVIENTKQQTIIGLGEAEHLKGTFYRIKSQLVRELILKNNIDLLIFEADLNTCAQLDKYVKGDNSIQLKDLLPQMNATNNYILQNILNTPEIAALINWVKDHNTTYEKKVAVAGIDFQMPANFGKILNSHLPPELQAALTDVINTYSKFYHGYMDYKNIFRLFTVDSLKKQAAEAADKVQQIDNYLRTSEDEWLQANLAALVCMSKFFTNPNGFTLRDTIMYNNLCLQVKAHKAIVWAATQHLQETSFWMGSYIRKKWGQQFYNIGVYSTIDCLPAPVTNDSIGLELFIKNKEKNCLENNNESIIISVKAKEIPAATVL